jgi:RNA polymerase sporulation-specific sigma factor
MEDLYQAGIIGLIKASKNYRTESEIKFSTYAYKYVLGEIIRCISEDRNIKVSDEYISMAKKFISIRKLLTDKYNREATFREISNFMEIDEETLLRILESVLWTKSIDDSMYNYGNDSRNEIDDKILIDDEIDNLDEFDKSIIYLRYYEGMTQSETAECMGVSQVKVSRQEKLILTKMKENLSA